MMNHDSKILIDFIFFILIYILFFYSRWRKKGKAILIIYTVMYIYIMGVMYFTLMPIITSLPYIFNHPYKIINTHPFEDFILGRKDSLRQIFLNIIMFIPFGILFPICRMADNKKDKFIVFFIINFLICSFIEFIQPLLSGLRSPDITDIITNTIGGLVGYTLYIIFKPVIIKIIGKLKEI